MTSRAVRQKLEKKIDLNPVSQKKEKIDKLVMAEVDDHANSHSEEDEVSEEEVVHTSRKKAESDSDAEIENGDDKHQPAAKKARKPKGKKRKSQDDDDDDDDSDDDWNKKKPVKKGSGARGAGGGGGGGAKKQSAFTKSFKLSPELADVVGSDVMPRHEVVKKLWAVIKERELQDPKNKQYAICDDQLMKVFGIKRFRTFGMMKHLKDHFLEAA